MPTTMSLAALNSPPLVGAITAGCYAALPFVAKSSLTAGIPFAYSKGLNALSYGLSMYSVSRPGRYDGAATVTEGADAASVGDVSKEAKQGMEQMGTSKGRTLVPPAPWAFIIWAPIFIGELAMVGAPILFPGSVSPFLKEALQSIAGPYFLAQVFQSLWAASFRPRYEKGWYKYISAASLAGIAGSLSCCHKAFCGMSDRANYSTGHYWLYFLPLSLHFGWTTAASLVNVNGIYAMLSSKDTAAPASARSVAWLGHASVIAATAIGVGITWTRTAPVYGGVICWALTAVAAGLKQRLEAAATTNTKKTNKSKEEVVGIYGAENQRMLSLMGATICASAVIAVMVR